MDERIRLIIEAQNRAAPAFQAAVRGLGNISTGAKSMGSAAMQASSTVRTAMQHVSDAAAKAGAAFTRLSTTARAGLDKIAGPLKAISTGLAGLGVAGGAAVGAFGALGIASNRFKENTLAALTGMTKNRAVAEDLYKFLSKFADTTPFDDEEIVSAGKSLLTFGFNAKQMMTLVGDAAFTMKVPIEQVVNALAKLKAGSFDMAEMAPVGITREGLEGLGQKFSAGGEPEDRSALLGQGIQLLTQKFGGAMASGASGFDAAFSTLESNFRRVAALATGGLFESLKRGFDLVSASLVRFMETSGASGGLAVIFDGIGRAVEIAANQGLAFVGWLDELVTRENVAVFLANILGLLQTIGQSVLQLFGVDLKAAMDPANVMAFFDAMGVGAAAAINGIFGIGRVMQELVQIGKSAFQDIGDAISDTIANAMIGFSAMFIGLKMQIVSTTRTILESLKSVLLAVGQALVALGSLKDPVFGAPLLPGMAAAGDTMRLAGFAAGTAAVSAETMQRSLQGEWGRDVTFPKNELTRWQGQRTNQRNRDDPFRGVGFGQRIGDAFSGTGRDTGAQTDFWRRFEQNRLGIAGSLFGGQRGAGGFPGAPTMGGTRGGSSVTIIPQVQIPSMPGTGIPSLPPPPTMQDEWDSGDFSAPSAGSPGVFAPMLGGGMMELAPPTAGDGGSQVGARRMGGSEQPGQVQATFVFNFSNKATLQQQVAEAVEALYRQVNPMPATF